MGPADRRTTASLGVPPDGERLPIAPFELQLGRIFKRNFMGSMTGRSDLPRPLDPYAEGRLNLDELVTHRLPMPRTVISPAVPV